MARRADELDRKLLTGEWSALPLTQLALSLGFSGSAESKPNTKTSARPSAQVSWL